MDYQHGPFYPILRSTHILIHDRDPSSQALDDPDRPFPLGIFRSSHDHTAGKFDLLYLSLSAFRLFLEDSHCPILGSLKVGVIASDDLGRNGRSENLSYTLLSEMSNFRSRVHIQLQEVVPRSFQ